MLKHFLKYTLLLLVVGSLSCSSVPQDPGTLKQGPGILRVAQSKNWFLELPNQVLRIRHEKGHASGFVFFQNDKVSLVATARHVAMGAGLGGTVALEWWDGATRRSEEGTVILTHPTEDVAVIRGPPGLPQLPIKELAAPVGLAIISGYPRDLFPASVTIGIFHIVLHPGFIQSSSAAWFGNSGGPVIDFRSGCVIGILVHLHGDQYGPLANRNCSVPIGVVLVLARQAMEE